MSTTIPVFLPNSLPIFAKGVVDEVHVAPGAVVAAGTAIIDFTIDLSGGLAFDCPPEAYFRLILNEDATIESLSVTAGLAFGPELAIGEIRVSGDAEARVARVSAASVVREKDWWDEDD